MFYKSLVPGGARQLIDFILSLTWGIYIRGMSRDLEKGSKATGVGFVILNAQFIYNFCTEFKSIKRPLGLIKSTFKKHDPEFCT